MDRTYYQLGYNTRMHLNTMLGFAGLLADPELDLPEEKRVRYAEAISRHGAALAEGVDQFLTALTDSDTDGARVAGSEERPAE